MAISAIPSIHPVGIDDLNVYGSTLAIEHAAVAAARGLTVRDVETVGFRRRSLTPPYEDAVTLAVNAARPVVDAAGRNAFELLIVATESGVDYGKPLSAYVHRHLRLGARCRNVELKHACYAGTAAIQLAASWLRAGEVPGRKALVIMTDLARRHVGDPGELTAGSGAVAVSIGAAPAVLEIEVGSGYACREVYDVARPTATKEHADAVLSLAAYLDLVEEAWRSYQGATGTAEPIDARFRYLLYHTPLISLVRQAHALLLQNDHDDYSPAAVAESFDRMVRPALTHACELANLYSGSVYALLAGLLDGDADIPAGTRVGICSYGSGSCAELYGAIVVDGARARIARHGIGAHLSERVPVDVPTYERLVCETDAAQVSAQYRPPRELIPGHYERAYAGQPRLVLLGIENHYRRYGWAEDRSDGC